MSRQEKRARSNGLLNEKGERKYLDSWECRRFYRKRKILKNLEERTIVEILFLTGCRMTEAVMLKVRSFDIRACTITFRTLKQRNKTVYRVLQIPRRAMRRLNRVHDLKRRQAMGEHELEKRVWTFNRQRALKIVQSVMTAAGIYGVRATGRGLRHSFAVRKVMKSNTLNVIQDWLGHKNISMTTIYTAVNSRDARRIARRGWSFYEVFG